MVLAAMPPGQSYPENDITLRASGTVAKPILVVAGDMLDGTGGFGNRGVNFQAKITIRSSHIIFGGFSINGDRGVTIAPIPNNDSAIVINGHENPGDATNVRVTDFEARENVSGNYVAGGDNSKYKKSWDGFIDLRKANAFQLDHSYFTNNDQSPVRLYEGSSTSPSQSLKGE